MMQSQSLPPRPQANFNDDHDGPYFVAWRCAPSCSTDFGDLPR